MAEVHSKSTAFTIEDTGSSERDISNHVTSVDGLPGERELSEVTALGESGRSFIPGLENAQFTLELNWEEGDATDPDDIFGPLRTHTSTVTFKYGPEGSTGGDRQYTGSCWVRNYVVTSRVGEVVTARAECQVDGQVTRGTF